MFFCKRLQQTGQITRRIAALSMPYFVSEHKWRARGLLLAIVLLNLASVYMLVLINDWNRLFYDALEQRNQAVFWQQLERFGLIAFAYILVVVYRFYLTQLLQWRWREWLTGHYMQTWLHKDAFYLLELKRYSVQGLSPPDNPDQRIQEDLNLFTTHSVTLSMGLLNALVTLASFVGILWTLSGSVEFNWAGQSHEITGLMVWLALIYCAVGSALTHWIGRRQIGLNFLQQQREANFRHHLVRVREYSESIALDRGQKVELQQLRQGFQALLDNFLALLKAQKNLAWFTNFFGQAAVVFPFIVAAPRFFSGAIQLGELMQIASAFGRVQDALSWLVDNYSEVAAWRASADRLTSFDVALLHSQSQDPHQVQIDPGPELFAKNLCLQRPNGSHLLSPTQLHARAGQSILLQGPSGSGKSTLFRCLAGVWPYAQGHLQMPAKAMFIPQRAYFPNGGLRQALAYPENAEHYSETQLQWALRQALLPHFCERLDEEQAWNQSLSGGEQQRLALARVFLKQPQWVFADEATSALDESSEATLYQRLKETVLGQGGSLISIAHRPSVAAFHERVWTLTPSAPDTHCFEWSESSAQATLRSEKSGPSGTDSPT